MTKNAFKTLLLTLMLFLLQLPLVAKQNMLKGIWLGKLEVNKDVQLSIAFEVVEGQDQQLSAVAHSIDQQSFDIPVEEVILDGDTVIFKLPSLNATYTGHFTTPKFIQGSLAQNSASGFVLNLKKVDSLPFTKARRLQEPGKPYPYKSEEVSYRNETANITLAGTLTTPQTPGPHPAIVLISGSGPNDRDQTIFGHKVFLVLADMLTRRGFAVLRSDDRGVHKSTGEFETASIVDLASDVVAAVDFLKTRSEIDKSKIGLAGHSLGAEIAPIAANKTNDVSFVVLMAGNATTPAYKGLYEHNRAYLKSIGVSDAGIKINEKVLQAVFESVASEEDNDEALALMGKRFRKLDTSVAKLSMEERKKLELPTPLEPKQFAAFLSPAYRVDLFYDTQAELEKVACPVLAINGDKDVQVLPINLQRIEKALKKGGNQNYTLKEFKNKNHLFQTAITGTVAEYHELEETIAPDVVEFISVWIKNLPEVKAMQRP